MTDEVSEHTRIALTVWMTGALIAVVSGVLIMSLKILNEYTGKYNTAVMASADSTVNGLQGSVVPGAIVYSSVSESLGSIDRVYILDDDGTKYDLYVYNDINKQNLIKLMTTYKNNNYTIKVTDGEFVNSLRTVILQEVVRE